MHEAKKVRFAVLFSLDSARTRVRLHVYTRTCVCTCIYKPREHHGDLRFVPSSPLNPPSPPWPRIFSVNFPRLILRFSLCHLTRFPDLFPLLSFSPVLLLIPLPTPPPPHPTPPPGSPSRTDSMRKVNMLQYSNGSRATLY